MPDSPFRVQRERALDRANEAEPIAKRAPTKKTNPEDESGNFPQDGNRVLDAGRRRLQKRSRGRTAESRSRLESALWPAKLFAVLPPPVWPGHVRFQLCRFRRGILVVDRHTVRTRYVIIRGSSNLPWPRTGWHRFSIQDFLGPFLLEFGIGQQLRCGRNLWPRTSIFS